MRTGLDQGSVSTKTLPGARRVPSSHEHTLSRARPPQGIHIPKPMLGM